MNRTVSPSLSIGSFCKNMLMCLSAICSNDVEKQTRLCTTMRRFLTTVVLTACVSRANAFSPRKSYVVSHEGDVDEMCDALEGNPQPSKILSKCHLWKLRIKCKNRMSLAKAFSLHLNSFEVDALRSCVPTLEFFEDGFDAVSRSGVSRSWGVDRMNQRMLPLDSVVLERDHEGFGSIVHVFILDTGVRRTHVEFRDQLFGAGSDFVDEDDIPDDCDGHGTHVASTVAQVAFARKTILHPIRVLDCYGNGDLTSLLRGLELVVEIMSKLEATAPAVVSLALGVKAVVLSGALERIVRELTDRGVLVVTASGNQNTDACTISPGNVEDSLTVSAVDERDARYGSGNTGPCVDLFAPGVNILGAEYESDTAYAFKSGTSMAVSHAVGAATRILSLAPDMPPRTTKRHLIATATRDVVRGSLLPNTPNALLYIK